MSNIRTRSIGEIFEYYKHKYKVVESKGCEGCSFNTDGLCYGYLGTRGYCTALRRNDGKDVIFKQIDE